MLEAAASAAAEIRAMARADLALRQSLAKSGALFGGYHPEMAQLHRRHAERLRSIIESVGWPSPTRDGAEVVDNAWLIVQHAIGEPQFQRHMLVELTKEADAGRLPAARVALLEDRIRSYEGRPQRYGTQVDWDPNGELSPWPEVEEPEWVDLRRAAVDLPPLAEQLQRLRAEAEDMGERPPADLGAYRAAALAWARSVGWRP
ncbi:MAG: DUF6624 domain-containing protein [Gemmatimonadales bacterium]